MKIIMILGTGILLTFPSVDNVNPDCFSQGHSITQKISTYHGPEEKGEDQGWYLNGTKIHVTGFYCD
jgi:hypothetical protein